MGFFDKKYCDICGEKIGVLGNRKLDDGNLCKNCAKKLSPWFEKRRHSTVEEIQKQLAYREANKEKVQAFQITREFIGNSYHVFIDDHKGQFAVATGMNREVNPDIVDLSQVTSCKLDVRQNRKEEQYRDQEGKLQDYNPPRYQFSYDYWIKVGVRSQWFDDMEFRLNAFSIDEHDRRNLMEMENLGNEIVAALTGARSGQPIGMQNSGAYGQPMYGGMPQRGPVAAPAMAGAMPNAAEGTWRCSCGAVNGAKFCQQCGQPRLAAPMAGYQQNPVYRCDKCGWMPSDPNQIPRFCPECGDPFNGNDAHY